MGMESFKSDKGNEKTPINEGDSRFNRAIKKVVLPVVVAASALMPNNTEAQTTKENELKTKIEQTFSDSSIVSNEEDKLYEKTFDQIVLNCSEAEKKKIALTIAQTLLDSQYKKVGYLLDRQNMDKDDYHIENQAIKDDYGIEVARGKLPIPRNSFYYLDGKAHFPKSFKRKEIPNSKDTFDLLVAETPHLIQEKRDGKKFMKKIVLDFLRYGPRRVYKKSGTMENEAHSKIQPELVKKYDLKNYTSFTDEQKKDIALFVALENDLRKIKNNSIDLNQYICNNYKNIEAPFVVGKIKIPAYTRKT